MTRATALVQHVSTGRQTEITARGESRKAARYAACSLIREGETLIQVTYKEES